MRKPNRDRRSVTTTLSEDVMTVLNNQAKKYGGNRSLAFERIVMRYEGLIASVDLSSITDQDFRWLSMMADVHGLESGAEPARSLRMLMHLDLEKNRDVFHVVRDAPMGTFTDDTKVSRDSYAEKLENEFLALQELDKRLRSLDRLQSIALLEALEEVLSGSGEDRASDCEAVYQRLQKRKTLT